MQISCVTDRTQLESPAGFTLVELLVTVVIVALVGTLVLAGAGLVRQQTQQAVCMGNQRQLGVAILGYCQDHHGDFPMTSHGLDASNHTNSWVFSLAEYLADVDEVRICPADPKSKERLEAHGTSYVLNSYLTVAQQDPFGRSLGGFTNINQLTSPATTPLAFIINFSKGVGYGNDHTHSESWDSWGRMLADIQPDAFRGDWHGPDRTKGSANYLFADGHVENLAAAQIQSWITSGHNFANPASSPQ